MRQFTVDEIERAIVALRDEQQSRAMQVQIQTRLEIVGLTREKRLGILSEMQPHLPDVEEEFIWLNVLQDLWESQYFEARLIGLELMFATPDLVDAHLWGMLDHWTNGVDNWVLADWLGHVRAIAIYKTRTLVMRMAPWLQSVDPWRRRSAIVGLMYIDPRNLEKTLLLEPHESFAFVEPVLADRHDAVQKALAWLLKQIGAQYPDELSKFLYRHKMRLANGVVDLASEGLPVAIQERF